MKRTDSSVIPLILCCLLSPLLRLIPQTGIWSPHIWQIGEMFGLGKLTAVVLISALALWAGHFGSETIKRAGAVALPILVVVLAATIITGSGSGLSKRYLPLAATNVISSDFLLISWIISWFFDILKKVEKN